MANIRLQATRLRPTDSLSDHEIQEIWDFYAKYAKRDKDAFIESLKKTSVVGRCFNDDKHIVAFWAITYIDVSEGKRRIRAFHVNWAAIDKAYRGYRILHITGICTFFKNRLKHPFTSIYWMFTATTYMSYLLITNNCKEYFPRIDRKTPDYLLRMSKAFSKDLDGLVWDDEGAVLKRNYEVQYTEGLVSELAEKDSNPDIDAYRKLNPHQERGDSLVCIAPLNVVNFSTIVWRMLTGLVKQ